MSVRGSRLLLALLAALWGHGRVALATDALRLERLSAEQVTQLAEALLDRGQFTEAATLLARLEADAAGGPEREFAQGMLALAMRDYRQAERRFRTLLDRDPRLTRVRLELARTLFLLREDRAADYHFRLAIAGETQPQLLANVERFRRAIRARRAWTMDLGVGIAPDSNINGASSKQRVDIYGLPFELDADSRSHSGVGLSLNVDGGYRFRRDHAVPFYVGGYGRSLAYGRSDFNDAFTGLEAGPEFQTRHGRVRVAATGFRRWYGNAPYQASTGLRVALETPVAARWSATLAGDARASRFSHRPFLDGSEYNLFGSLSRVMGPSTLLGGWAGMRRTTARDEGYASVGGRLGIGLTRELGWGLRGGASIDLVRSRYDAAIPAFGVRRREWSAQLGASLQKRDWNLRGFAPQLRVGYTTTHSTIPLYDTERWQVELELVRTF